MITWGQRVVTGRVIDTNKNPIPYATVKVVGNTSKKAIADAKGSFSIEIGPGETSLEVECIGFEPSSFDLPESDGVMVTLRTIYVQLDALLLLQPVHQSQRMDSLNTLFPEFAKFPGGLSNFFNMFNAEIIKNRYDSLMRDPFDLKFSVDKAGSLLFHFTNITVIDSILTQVAKSLPKWNPASQNGYPATQHFSSRVIPDQYFIVVEEPAYPKGGMQAFYKFVAQNLRYPKFARRNGIEGRIFVTFIVEKDGSLTEVEVVEGRGIGGGCDEEAVRVVSLSPKWIPGTQKGEPVRQRYTVPINFRLH